jgi:GNAT superfamily N-acetyltransferase
MTIERVLEIRLLTADDAPAIAEAFAAIGWSKPAEQYLCYVDEGLSDRRICWVATMQGRFAGYVTLVWHPECPGLAGTGTPEIQDLNVLPDYRRRGIATRANAVAIGVGLHPGYNAAQRLYVKRGYVPDGLGVTHKNRYVKEGETVPFDDELVLHFIKDLDVQSRH